jgi:hypothetical protein
MPNSSEISRARLIPGGCPVMKREVPLTGLRDDNSPGAPKPWIAHEPSVSWITSRVQLLRSSVRRPWA